MPGALAGATSWPLTNCSNSDDEPQIIVPCYTLSIFAGHQTLYSSNQFLLIQHHIIQMPGRFWLKNAIVKNEIFMNGPSHTEGGQVYYGELVVKSALFCPYIACGLSQNM